MTPPARSQARALLMRDDLMLTRRAGAFLGQLCVDPTPLSEPQLEWLDKLLDRAGLPLFSDDGGNA